MVEFLAEGVEAPLLGGAVACWWAGGLGFKGFVHAFMAAVLLGFARFDELRQDQAAKNVFESLAEPAGLAPDTSASESASDIITESTSEPLSAT